MRGSAREEALQASLGISTRGEVDPRLGLGGGDDDDGGMRELAEAIECAVRGRGNRDGLLGLDWRVSVDCPERE